MRTITLHVTVAASLLLGTASFGAGIPTIDVAAIAQAVMNYEQQVKDYANQIEQLQQQVRMVEMQSQNLKSLDSYSLDNLGSVLYRQKQVMNGLNAISYDAGNVSSKFENTYKDYDGYSSELSSASNQAARNTAYSDRYKQITATNQNTLNGTMQKLQLSYEDLDSESSTIAALKKRSDDAEGNLQVLQATNDLLTYLIDEIRKLRVTTMDQTNAIANYLAAQNNEKILSQSIDDQVSNKDNRKNIYDHSTDQNAFKLPGAR